MKENDLFHICRVSSESFSSRVNSTSPVVTSTFGSEYVQSFEFLAKPCCAPYSQLKKDYRRLEIIRVKGEILNWLTYGPKLGKQTGTPPLMALDPSITAFLDTKISSWPSTIHEMMVAPKGTTVNVEFPLPCFNSILFRVVGGAADIVEAWQHKKMIKHDKTIWRRL